MPRHKGRARLGTTDSQEAVKVCDEVSGAGRGAQCLDTGSRRAEGGSGLLEHAGQGLAQHCSCDPRRLPSLSLSTSGGLVISAAGAGEAWGCGSEQRAAAAWSHSAALRHRWPSKLSCRGEGGQLPLGRK